MLVTKDKLKRVKYLEFFIDFCELNASFYKKTHLLGSKWLEYLIICDIAVFIA